MANIKNILILTSYQGNFQMNANFSGAKTMDVRKVADEFEKKGYGVMVKRFEDICEFKGDLKDWFVLYNSSEETGLFYKSYIEDVLQYVEIMGGNLIPKYYLMKAHHNKVMMEFIRCSFKAEPLKTISSKMYCFPQSMEEVPEYPLVLKSSAGAGSSGVFLCSDATDLYKSAKKVALSPVPKNLVNKARRYVKREQGKYKLIKQNLDIERSKYAQKFVVQNFISGLEGDFKVLIYWDKYYILQRANRDNDFRASGSGKFSFPKEDEKYDDLLEFAALTQQELREPICSLDIGHDGHSHHLIEFQCVCFGTLTMTESDCYFTKKDGQWIRVEEKPCLEETYTYAIDSFLSQNSEG